MEQGYRTAQIAKECRIHPNTVRLYEKIGFIKKPDREENGYRIFTELQKEQCQVVRLAMRAEVLQNGLRQRAIRIVKCLAEEDYDGALSETAYYKDEIDREIGNAEAAISSVEKILRDEKKDGAQTEVLLTRKEAAERLNVTVETLRTWERSGLVCVSRGQNGYRLYDSANMERLNIIKMLRCASYSLSSILRLLSKLEKNAMESVETVLNTPEENETIISVCDRLVLSLRNTKKDAEELRFRIEEIKKKNEKRETLQ